MFVFQNRPAYWWLTQVAYVLGWLAGIGGGLLFAGCMFDIPPLYDLTGQITTKTNAALAALLCGQALVLLIAEPIARNRLWVGRACAVLVLVLGSLTLSEHVFGWDLGIDQLLAQESPGAVGMISPNRMGPPVALSFVLLGAALLMLSRPKRYRRWRATGQLLALAATMVGMVTTIAYLFSVNELYGNERYTAIAWPMAFAILALGLGVLCARPAEGIMKPVTADDLGGMTIRRLLPAAVLVPMVVGWVHLTGVWLGWCDNDLGEAFDSTATAVFLCGLVYYGGRRLSKAESQIRRKSILLDGINRVIREALTSETEAALAERCLSVAEELTGSQFGFVGKVNLHGRMDTIAISNLGWDACRMPVSEATRLIMDQEIRGLRGLVMLEGRPVITNRPASHPDFVSPPPGHPPLNAFLAVPLLRDGQALGMIGLGNRPGGFSVEDRQDMEVLAAAFVEALMHKRSEENLRRARDELEQRVLERTADLENVNAALHEEFAERQRVANELERIEWLLDTPHRPPASRPLADLVRPPAYGDLAALNTDGLILRCVGKQLLGEIVGDYLDILETAAAVYEVNGDYALGVFHSGWCQFINQATRNLCETDDNREAMGRGKWLCHESCWTGASRRAIETGQPVDAECACSVRVYSVPVRAGGRTVGAINFCYGDPPREPGRLRDLADRFGVDVEDLTRHADAYETRPPFIIETAKRRLRSSARLIGEIVERRMAEDALAESELRYRTLVESLPQQVWTCQPDGNMDYFSPQSLRYTGVPDQGQLGMGWTSSVHPDDQATVQTQLSRAINTGTPPDTDIRLRRHDGVYRWFRVRAMPLRNLEGQIVKWFGTNTDVHHQKETERQLQQRQQELAIRNRIAEIFLTAPDDEVYDEVLKAVLETLDSEHGVFGYIDEDGNLIANSVTRQAPQQCVRGNGHVFPHARWGDHLWPRALRQKKTYPSNGSYHALHGHVPLRRNIVAPIVEQRKAIGMFQVANKATDYDQDDSRLLETIAAAVAPILHTRMQRDAKETERVQAEAEIRRLNATLEHRVLERTAQLEAANKELEAFSFSVSHDLRAPLRHVQGYAGMLAEAAGDQLSEKAQRYLTTILEASADMGRLIDDLLAYSRTGRAVMQPADVKLDELVQESIQGLEMATALRNIEWKIAPLPVVSGDRSMLKQVIVNLLDNAVKYTRPRDPAEIEVGAAGMDGQHVVLFVRDNGVGFDMEYAKKLFGVFQRLHRADEFEGTGIGLANVRRIVGRHGGRTWAESAPDRGATFYCTLPAADAAELAGTPKPECGIEARSVSERDDPSLASQVSIVVSPERNAY